ncbi:hypothetical protein GCM10025882_26610 [Acinetobacter gyllenbergii]|uniref:DUF1311 domain-containing protein n=2 Tax=Acinetobacter gyllenbergii CIP 110306 = MTCC 11365 TaxID=1217657 RepID=A0A829HI57_9GAMM|nr:hypothetical protein [Acinetobacter gyllenbergii]EPF83596.1 hypothetical protein F957_01942 [Acinetobacter gyllenbergii CIP 110306 = MTCC 11365]GMA12236.1 hypothetical protein GCM10025882_26610 [Acinetobacter gyllenbergii]
MRKVFFLVGILLSGHCFATYNQNFEKEYLRILDESQEKLLKEYQFNESYKGQELSEAEWKEAKKIQCDGMKAEFAFYQLVTSRYDEFVTYHKQNNLELVYDENRYIQEFNNLKKMMSDPENECN